MDFAELVVKTHESRPDHVKVQQLLIFDPGHTTGWALFHEGSLEAQGQISTQDIAEATTAIKELIYHANPKHIVLEDYRVYRWRSKHHVGSDLLTTRVIGCIETLAALSTPAIPITKQPAHVAKLFVTDKKLIEWGFFDKGQDHKHAMDAIRHGCYYILFGKSKSKTAPRKPKVG